MAAIHTLEIASVHVGGRLGFYRALAEGGAATPTDLAARTGTAERYVREWLEQQAVAGFVDVDDPAADADARRYTLPDAHHAVFVDEESLSHLTGLAQLVVGVLRPIDELVEAYRSGAGVPYPAYGADTVEGIAATNRPQFHNLLADWFAAVPEIDARLRADPPAHVADLGCGTGGRASRSRGRIRRRPSRRSTRTPTRSSRRAATSAPPVWPIGCDRSSTARARRSSRGATTWSRSSRRCTT